MLKILMTAAILSIASLISTPSVEAANVDDELSIMAAEQRKDDDADVTVSDDIETFDNSKSEQPIQEEAQPQPQPQPKQQSQSQPSTLVLQPTKTQQNPVANYANFAEASKKVGFIPLYVPRKSGYAMNNISVINDNIVELRYGRRWEPTVTLAIRTYKRAPGEQVKDISGISGVKWKVDMSSGMTLYIARISDNSSVAAWSVGQYTFAAMTENLSFAAFHALIVEELVDLCNHYFIDLN